MLGEALQQAKGTLADRAKLLIPGELVRMTTRRTKMLL